MFAGWTMNITLRYYFTMKICFTLILTLLINLSTLKAQSLIDQLSDSSNNPASNIDLNLTTEKISKVSASRKIYILSNNNSSFFKGDFISLVIGNKLAVRALVAKTENQVAGIKVLKIYNPELWKALLPGMDVQIIRGDDSYFNKKVSSKNGEATELSKIQDEDDLYNETALLEDDLSLDENPNRLIKTDNVISAGLAMVEGVDVSGGTKRYNQLNATWAYQFDDNIWGEIQFGQNVIKDFPDNGLDTKFTNFTIKGKYTISAPFFSYVMPYAGYQIKNASSPGGEGTAAQLEQDQERLARLESKGIIFGITVLKRLVPGWFGRLDLGTDALNFGLALEF
tara:strand:+ start:53711 stop:54730 length:1020 start_codon:yes stop_codon:yes gene_type:complete